MDHIQELKSRFFWVAVFFVVAAGASYPFFQDIVDLLIKPLGNHRLYYLSPAGGFSFIIKICMYAGFIGVLPVVIYHLYKFVAPVMKKEHARAVIGYTVASTFLAAAGIVFAYIVSLPAALHFLTDIDVKQVTAMLTIDAYMSFIVAYLIAGALLFQLPLVMLIINSVTPLKPKSLMNFQRHIIVGSFVIAAVISPTPDAVNQTLLAAPMVIMYQIGIVLVWSVNRKKSRRAIQTMTSQRQKEPVEKPVPARPALSAPALAVDAIPSNGSILMQEATPPVARQQLPRVSAHPGRPAAMRRYADQPVRARTIRRSIDGMAPSSSLALHYASSRPHDRAPHTVVPDRQVPRTTIDGFLAPAAS